MKVLLATPFTKPVGGITVWAQNIHTFYSSDIDKDIQLEIFPMDREPHTNNLRSKFIRLIGGISAYTKYIITLKKHLLHSKPNVFHLVSSGSISLLKDMVMLSLAKIFRVNTLIHFHYGRIPELAQRKNWEWKLLSIVLKLADCVLVLDERTLKTLVGASYKHVRLLPNPISPKISQIIQSNSNLSRRPRQLLFAGHVIPTKGVFELIEACKNIQDIQLKIIGNVSDAIRQELLSRSHNADWLEIAGEFSYEKTISEMQQCDVFVLPTYTEGFPNVILESMACRCAIVTTNVGAIPEMLEADQHGAYGTVIEPKDVQQLQEAIIYMLNHPEYAEECRRNAQRRVHERYSMNSIWEQLTTIWKQLTK